MIVKTKRLPVGVIPSRVVTALDRRFLRRSALGFLVGVSIGLVTAGCEDSGGGGGLDFGTNDPNVIVCVGDSITDDGYPSILAGLTGKTAINVGVRGSGSELGVSETPGLLEGHRPGYLCILYGINDIDRGKDSDWILGNLKSIVEMAKANRSLPIIATLTPVTGENGVWAQGVQTLNGKIRAMAREEGVRLADLESAFGDNPALLQDDGLHPTAAGSQTIAETFAAAIDASGH